MAKHPEGPSLLVFALVWSAFTAIYVTQPVLPVLQQHFRVNESLASLTVSAVILGIAVSNLPFGLLADRLPLRTIVLTGGLATAGAGMGCALTPHFEVLVGLRFVQGIFVPALSTCIAAHLATTLPRERLNVAMGSYVSATVAGGLTGRLLGGWLEVAMDWRWAFIGNSLQVAAVTAAAALLLPRRRPVAAAPSAYGYLSLVTRVDLLVVYATAFAAFSVFSSIFNYLPFYLAGSPFYATTGVISMLYLTYLVGIGMGPLAGTLSDRFGNGAAMAAGAAIFMLSIGATLTGSLAGVVASLAGVCAGFFTIHSAAAGSLNRSLTSGQGRANALYVLFYYLGGASGITVSGWAYQRAGWLGVAVFGWTMLLVPLLAGTIKARTEALKTESPRNPQVKRGKAGTERDPRGRFD
jgi:YNFM family putative membrane transporter